MLNYAQEQSVIERVLAGMDVHQATADMLGVSRFHAKTINFMLIYGGGIDKLASMLKLSWEDAKRAREDYFRKLPRIAAFVQRVRDTAGRRGYLYNWFGRYYTFDNPESVYTTAPNWLIQGGCSDVLKIAMIRCHEYLQQRGAFSRIVLNVHDEIVFELEKGELHYARELVSIMENVYMGGALKLTAGPAFSWKSLADKEDGFPVYSKHHPHEEMHDGQGDEASAAAR